MSETPREALIERMAIAMCNIGQVEWAAQEDHRKAHFRKQAEAALEATDFGQAVERLPFAIQTPREGLLTIVAELNGAMAESPATVMQRIREYAAEGLTGREDYRTTDALADRYAECWDILMHMVDPSHHWKAGFPPEIAAAIEERIPGAINLPPDLEAMVERRVR